MEEEVLQLHEEHDGKAKSCELQLLKWLLYQREKPSSIHTGQSLVQSTAAFTWEQGASYTERCCRILPRTAKQIGLRSLPSLSQLQKRRCSFEAISGKKKSHPFWREMDLSWREVRYTAGKVGASWHERQRVSTVQMRWKLMADTLRSVFSCCRTAHLFNGVKLKTKVVDLLPLFLAVPLPVLKSPCG